jgi:MYXO-CTERM domain-containing protein
MPAADTAIEIDTGRVPGPGTITENPNDPNISRSEKDGCTCQAPGTSPASAAPIGLLVLAAALLRRKR